MSRIWMLLNSKLLESNPFIAALNSGQILHWESGSNPLSMNTLSLIKLAICFYLMLKFWNLAGNTQFACNHWSKLKIRSGTDMLEMLAGSFKCLLWALYLEISYPSGNKNLEMIFLTMYAMPSSLEISHFDFQTFSRTGTLSFLLCYSICLKYFNCC